MNSFHCHESTATAFLSLSLFLYFEDILLSLLNSYDLLREVNITDQFHGSVNSKHGTGHCTTFFPRVWDLLQQVSPGGGHSQIAKTILPFGF